LPLRLNIVVAISAAVSVGILAQHAGARRAEGRETT
jgi:hypothetical protein